MNGKDTVFVIGHKNPDTDSICSAIAYAYLKNQMPDGKTYIAKRAGEINSETQYVLDTFGFDGPEYVSDVRTQVRDTGMTAGERVKRDISVKKAWEILNRTHGSTLAVVDDAMGLEGLITIGDIAKSIMDVHGGSVLADAGTPYANIVETLEAEVLVGDVQTAVATGKVIIAAANPDLMEESIEPGDMVILGDRYESQLCAIEMQAGCLIICIGSPVSESILELAREKGCIVLRTAYDTFITARLLNQSIPVGYFMIKNNLTYFRVDEYTDEVRGIMGKLRHREFPVLDMEGRLAGMLTRHSLLETDRKKVILVDHNETGQAVDGLSEAEIEEIVDHHKLGFVETMRPVLFRNQPVGCTSTIIYMIFKEQNIEIPPDIAGLMCSAIISDTLLYRSPTCTEIDKTAAEELASIAGIHTEEHAKAMFAAGSNLKNKTAEEIFYQDFKRFKTGDKAYGIGQITSMDGAELAATTERMSVYMENARTGMGLDMLYFMLTDILKESTTLICVGPDALSLITGYTGVTAKDNTVELEGVVSRKKQMVPMVIQALQ